MRYLVDAALAVCRTNEHARSSPSADLQVAYGSLLLQVRRSQPAADSGSHKVMRIGETTFSKRFRDGVMNLGI